MINEILDGIKYILVGVGFCSLVIVISDRIYNCSQPTKPTTTENWCKNKPDGVVMQTYHGKVNYDDPNGSYYYQETCYKKAMKDVVNFSEDTGGWVIRVNCQADTSCYHHLQKIKI